MDSYLEKTKNEKSEGFSFFLFYILLVCGVYILPFFKFMVPYMLAAPLMLATLIPFLFKKTEWTSMAIWMCMVFLILAILSGIFGGSPTPVEAINNVLIRNIRFFLPVFWGCYALKNTSKKQQGIFLLLFFALIAFIFIKTLIALEADPWIARILAQSKETSDVEINQYRLQNIGGFEFSYMMGIITLCLTWCLLRVKKLWIKIICAVAVVLTFYYIIETMYTTLLLLTFAGVMLLICMNIKSPAIKALIVVVAIVLVFSLAPILKYLSTVFEKDSLLNLKFESFYYALTKADIGEVGSRPEKLMYSFNRWLEAPLFGSYDKNSNAHSLMVSVLETGGIVGFIPWFSAFFIGYKMLKDAFAERGLDTKLLFVTFVFVILLSFFNPIGYVFEVTITAFFIVPVFSSFINDSERECELCSEKYAE